MRLNINSIENGFELSGINNLETVFTFTILTSSIVKFSENEIVFERGCFKISEQLYTSIYADSILSTKAEVYDFIKLKVN